MTKISNLTLIKGKPDNAFQQSLIDCAQDKPFVILWLAKDERGHDMPNIGYDATDQEAAFLLAWGMSSLMKGYQDDE